MQPLFFPFKVIINREMIKIKTDKQIPYFFQNQFLSIFQSLTNSMVLEVTASFMDEAFCGIRCGAYSVVVGEDAAAVVDNILSYSEVYEYIKQMYTPESFRMLGFLQNPTLSTCGKPPLAETAKDPKSLYYDAGGIEVLDVIKAKLSPAQYQGFLLGNSIKYTCRLNFKNTPARDAEKAAFYTEALRAELQKSPETS
ncbi:MAG TPA: DUF3310 domain-containing protein [Cellvibrionaceae bacterium]